MKNIYLDYAAATPVDAQVAAAMRPYYSDKFQNPSASYSAAHRVRAAVKTARQDVAKVIGARPSEIIFTAGGTESNNLGILGVAQSFPGTHIVTSALEHDSVLMPIIFLESRGWSKSEVKPGPDGIVDAQAIVGAVTDQTVLVSVMYANNEIGTIQPLRKIAAGLKNIKVGRLRDGNKLPLYFHTDACQAANYLDLQVHRLGADLMTLNGGKIYGPKQSGMLFASSQVELTPIIHGGGQEHGRRSGTENVPAIIGFAEALKLAHTQRRAESRRLQLLQKIFFDGLADKLPQSYINGSRSHRLPNNIHITLPGSDNERLLFGLDAAGIEGAAGSACSASKVESSKVLRSIGLSDEEARASLRFTMGRGTGRAAIMNAVETLANLVA